MCKRFGICVGFCVSYVVIVVGLVIYVDDFVFWVIGVVFGYYCILKLVLYVYF